MRKTFLIISALMMLSACGGRQTPTEGADAAVTEPQDVSVQPQNCRMTGTIGEDKASIALEANGSEVTGVVTRCDFCEPINVEGSWQESHIKVKGVSLAGSYIEYELTVKGNTVQGVETLAAEGVVEEQDVTMTIE